ncbi:hypothetical protein HWV62_37362 [Athelia sp. TMB]|nr:hypothetical protein HWV62_37362 [Athelia sp. TMB]
MNETAHSAALSTDAAREVDGVILKGEKVASMKHDEAPGVKHLIFSSQTINTFGVSGNANMVNIAGDHITHINSEMEKENGLSLGAKEVYDWLAAPDVSQSYNAARKKHLENTGSWFLGDTKFSGWKKCPEGILCIYGVPFSVVTSIFMDLNVESSSIIEDVKESCTGYAYFFFDNRNSDQALVRYENLLRSLLSQAAYRGGKIPDVLRDMYNSHGSGRERPSLKSLRDVFQQVINEYDRFYIMIDSLDECEDRFELLDWIQYFASSNMERVHLLFTSRLEPDITNRLSSIARIDLVNIQGLIIRGDISDFVDKRLLLIKTWNKPTKELVKTTLVDKADGMFRWVALQVDELRRCLNPKDVKKQLKILPRTLEETYDRILAKSQHPDNLLQMLHWLTFSIRDMRLAELADVVSVDLHAEDGPCYDPDLKYGDNITALAVCSGLVTESHGIVKLSHFSVKEYLISERTKADTAVLFAINEQISHSVIVQTCLAYLLSFDKNESIVEGIGPFPLALYAAQCWFRHYQSVQHPESSPVQTLLPKLFSSSTYAMVNWIRLNDPESSQWWWVRPNLDIRAADIAQPLYYASFLGLKHIVEDLLDSGADINSRGGKLGTPLIAAVQRGRMETVKLLLSRGADASLQTGQFMTALYTASEEGHFDIVQALLDYNSQTNVGGETANSALSEAAYTGHTELVKLLLKHGANINTTNDESRTALQRASFQGHIEIARLLLERGADVRSRDLRGDSALSEAAGRGHTELVKLLLKEGADANITNNDGRTALHKASCWGNIKIAKLLIEHSADINSRDKSGDTALSEAAYRGYTQLVTLLLKQGADANIINNDGRTALHEASGWGNVKIARLLLAHGADTQSQDKMGDTALAKAAYRDHIELTKLLLEHGADVNITDNNGQTALHRVSSRGHTEIARLLLEHGAEIDSRDERGDTALSEAACRGHTQLVSLLLERGADFGITNNRSVTALQNASCLGHAHIARLLLEHGADIHSRDWAEDTPLSEAAYNGRTELVMLFLQRGARIEEGYPALHRASSRGHTKVARLLLEHGADVNARDKDGQTALLKASSEGHDETVRLLIAYGAVQSRDVCSCDASSREVVDDGSAEDGDTIYYDCETRVG